MMDVIERRLQSTISICSDVMGDPWAATATVRRDMTRGFPIFREYLGSGPTDTAALAALKEAVRAGEDGWTW